MLSVLQFSNKIIVILETRFAFFFPPLFFCKFTVMETQRVSITLKRISYDLYDSRQPLHTESVLLESN